MVLSLRAKSLNKRVTLFATAFVLAVSSVSGALPFLAAQKAGAVSGTAYTDVSLTGWTTDRTAPSGGTSVENYMGRQALKLAVDTPTGASSSFYQYEGVKKSVSSTAQTVKADLYIDPSWGSNVRVGFWGVGYDSTNAISAYPIVEYNAAVASHWRIFNSVTGAWTEVPVSSATTGWNTIELALNKLDSTQSDVYVNGTFIGQSQGDPTLTIRQIILNNYNQGTQDYNVYWSNIQTGTYTPNAPTGLRFVKGATSSTTSVAAGSTVNYDGVTLKWDAADDVDRYVVRQTSPSGAVEERRNQSTTYYAINDDSRYGYFGNEQGTYTYQVRVKSATTGLWSDYSAPITLKFDNQAPVATVTANGNALPDTGKVLAGANTSFVVTLSDPSGTPEGAYIELFKANSTGGYGTWVSDNTPSRNPGNVRGGSTPTLVYNMSGLSGKYGLKITYKDAIGNAASKYVYFTVDNTLPGVSFVTAPVQNSLVKGTVDVSAQATDTNPAEYTLTAVGTGAITGTNVSLKSVNPFVTGTTYTSSWNTKLTADGVYDIVAKATDQAGQENSATRTVTVDNTRPAVTITSPAIDGTYGKTLNVTGTATDLNGIKDGQVTVKLRGINAGTGSLGADLSVKQVTVTGGAWATTFDVSSYNDSLRYGITVVAYDTAENESNGGSGTSLKSFKIDVTAPQVTVSYGNTNLTNGNVLGYVTANEAIATPTSNPAGTWEKQSDVRYRVKFTNNGSRTVTVTDLYGNSTVINLNVDWIDKTAPLISGVTNNTAYRGEKSFVVSDKNFKQVTVNGTPQPATLGATDSDGVKTFTFPVLSGNGDYTIVATDLADNSTTVKITINNNAATTIAVDSTTIKNPTVSGVASYVADGTALANTNLIVDVDGTEYTTTTDANGAWSTPVAVEDGDHDITVKVVATSEVLGTYEFTSAIPPTATVTYSTQDLTKSDVTVTITFDEATTVTSAGWVVTDGTNNTQYTKVFTANATETVNFEDVHGNGSSVEVTVDNIDKDAPEFNSATANGEVVRDATVTFTVDDAHAVVVTANGDVVTPVSGVYTVSGDGVYTVRATDAANNSSEFKFTISHETTSTITVDQPNTATPTISGVATYKLVPASAANVALIVTVDDQTYNVTTDAGGAWSVQLQNNENGDHTVSVQTADADEDAVAIATTTYTTTIDPGTNGTDIPAITTEVLGATDDTDTAVEGSSTSSSPTDTLAKAINNTDGTAFGFAWYWWLLIIAGIAAIVWWIASVIRRRQPSDI